MSAGTLLQPLKIDGPLFFTDADRRDLHRVLDRHGGTDRASRFINELDMRLWYEASNRNTARDLWRKPIPKRTKERRQIEALQRAALTIMEILDDPAGDLDQRLAQWFDRTLLEQQNRHLLHFAAHTLRQTEIQHGANTTIPDALITDCRVMIFCFRNHYPKLAVTYRSSVCAEVARIAFTETDPEQLLKQAIHDTRNRPR